MSIPAIALVVSVALGLGGLAAVWFTRWMSRDNDRRLVLMAGVTAWSILFGLIPFGLFGLLVSRGVGGPTLSEAGVSVRFIIGLLPFTLLAAPLIGFAHSMAVTRTND